MRYLFYIAKKYSIPIIDPMIKYLRGTNNEFVIFASQKVIENLPESWKDIPVLTEIRDAKKFKPDFCLAPGNFIDFRIPGKKIQTFHGLGIEKPAHYVIRHFFDVYLTSGPVVTRKFEELQAKHKYFIIRETGWPKIDHILNYDTTGLKTKLNIPSDKKIILYAPTFSSGMESATSLLPEIPKIIKEDEYFVIKFHELMDKELIDEIKKHNSNRIKIDNSLDITPLLHVSDIMISDTSSVVYEFMVLDKPIITYRTIAREDKGINIESPKELRGAIDKAYDDTYAENRKKHLNEVNPYLDGKISERVFRELEKIKSENPLKGKRKPLNLFRKSQVIYHSIFRKGYLR